MTTKKPLFHRPAWALAGEPKTSPSISTEEPVFGRQRIYEDILAIERKEREERERKAKEKATSKDPEVPPPKKRRISKENDDAANASDSSIRSISHNRSKTPEAAEHKPITRSSPLKNRPSYNLDGVPAKRNSPRKSSKVAVITFDDGDSDVDISRIESAAKMSPSKARSKASPAKPRGRDADLLDSDDEDDPYLQQLKAKAREKQQLQRLGIELDKTKASTSPTEDLTSKPPPEALSPFDADFLDPEPTISNNNIPNPGPGGSPSDDPDVSIYIKPLIPNTKALIVGRKASQTLEPVKTFWCKKQDLTDGEAAKVFFTWRGIKLFNSSTMRHIVDRLKKERKPGQNDSEGKIIIEAMTQEIFDHQQEEKARRAAVEAGEFDDGLEEDSLSPPPEPATENKFIIKLQSKEHGEMPLRIRPKSTVDHIAAGYLQQMAGGTSKTCYLIFDGERLEAEQTAEEVGLEDGDVVEVQFRRAS